MELEHSHGNDLCHSVVPKVFPGFYRCVILAPQNVLATADPSPLPGGLKPELEYLNLSPGVQDSSLLKSVTQQ